MSERFFCDTNGRYLGAFDGAEPPEGAAEVPFPPGNASLCWNGTTWDVCPPTLDEQLSAIEASFEAKKAALASRLSTITLIDGADETAKRVAISAEYTTICDEKAAAIDAAINAALFGG